MKIILAGFLLLSSGFSVAKSISPNRKLASDEANLISFVGGRITDAQVSYRAMGLDSQMKFRPVLEKLTEIYGKMQTDLISGRPIGSYACADELENSYSIYFYSKKINTLLNKQDISSADKKNLSSLLSEAGKILERKNSEHLNCLERQAQSEVKTEKIDLEALKREFEALKK